MIGSGRWTMRPFLTQGTAIAVRPFEFQKEPIPLRCLIELHWS